MKTIFIVIALIFFVVVLLAVFSEKSVRAEISINATPEKIWSVLMDQTGYSEWNPVLVPLEGNLILGDTVTYKWTQGNGESIQIQSKVLKLEQASELHQRGGTPGVLTFDHRYELSPEGSGTRVVQSEVYRGIGVWFWDASQMQPAYQSVNESLKKRVQSID